MTARTSTGVRAALLSLGMLIALPGCGGRGAQQPENDLEFTQSMNSGRVAFDRGQVTQAVLMFSNAMRRAEARDDPADIGEAAYNLGICLIADGELAQAESVLETSQIELARAGRRTIDIRLVQAKLARRLGTSARADAAGIAAEVAAAKDATPGERSQALVLLAAVDLDAGRVDAAQARMAAARESLPAAGVSQQSRDAMEAGVVGLEARLAAARGDPATAAAAFDRQAALARSAALFDEMSAALLAAGEAYDAAGNVPAAADRLFRAARSLLAQNDRERGAAAVARCIEVAHRIGNARLAARAAALLGEPAAQPLTRPASQQTTSHLIGMPAAAEIFLSFALVASPMARHDSANRTRTVSFTEHLP